MRTTEYYLNHDGGGGLTGSPLRSPPAVTSTIRATAWWSSEVLRSPVSGAKGRVRPQYNMYSQPSQILSEMRVRSPITSPITASLPAILSPRDLNRPQFTMRLSKEQMLSPSSGWRAHDLPMLHQFSDSSRLQSPRIRAAQHPAYTPVSKATAAQYASPRHVARALRSMNAWSPRRAQVVRAQAIEQMRSDIDQHRMRVERVAPGPLHTKTTSVPPLHSQTSAEREAAADKEAAELQAGSATAAGVAMPASSLEGVEQAAAAANTEPC